MSFQSESWLEVGDSNQPLDDLNLRRQLTRRTDRDYLASVALRARGRIHLTDLAPDPCNQARPGRQPPSSFVNEHQGTLDTPVRTRTLSHVGAVAVVDGDARMDVRIPPWSPQPARCSQSPLILSLTCRLRIRSCRRCVRRHTKPATAGIRYGAGRAAAMVGQAAFGDNEQKDTCKSWV